MILFLDSNIYIGAKYRVDKSRFISLRLLLEHGDIQLIYTSVNLGEIKQHIKKDIEEGVATYNKVLKDKAVLLTADGAYHLENIEVEKGVKQVEALISDFFELPSVECIPIDPINAEQLMKDYFEQNPPFESKKPTEFKDAIIINALKTYQAKRKEKITVVSQDKGFCKAFDSNPEFAVFEKLDDFLKTYTSQLQEYEIFNCVEAYIDDGNVRDEVIEYLEDWDINRGYYGDWEYEEKKITDVESELLYIDVTGKFIVAHLETEVWLQADIKHRDEDDSFYDKEDHCYLYETWVEAIENHRTKIDIDLKIQIGKDEDGRYQVIDVSIIDDEKYHWLNIDEDTMTHYRETFRNYMGESRENLESCSCCGKVLGRNLIGAYFDYDGNPVCEDCMRADGKYDICPRCGRKVPHEHMMSGFCDQCISLKDVEF